MLGAWGAPDGPGWNSLAEFRATQHEDLTLQSDHAFTAYLRGCLPRTAVRDRTDRATPVERRMLATARA